VGAACLRDRGHSPDQMIAFTQELWEQLAGALAGGDWEILVAEARDRSAIDVNGQPATVRDTVLRAARRR
jgi:hypothetical protein